MVGLKILEICLNQSLGGLELYYFWCCQYFKKTSHELIAVTLSGSRLEARLREEGLSPVLFEKRGFFDKLKIAYKLARLFENRKIDIVHVHFAKDLQIVAFAKMLSRQRVRIVHSRQMEMPGSKKDLYHRWLYSKVDHIICVTEKLKNELRDRVPLPSEKISCLYYGVPKPQINTKTQKEFLEKFPSNKLKVAMFSRLEKSKGQWRLLEAVHLLKKQGLELQVYLFGHFMGGDGYEEYLKKQIQQFSLEEQVYWCGFHKVPGEVMPCFDLILLPSDQETFGLVLIEAMAAGVAIMGSNTGGVPEIIEDGINGHTFFPDDIEEMSLKIKSILTNQALRNSFIQAGLQKYERLFRADQHYLALEKILKNS